MICWSLLSKYTKDFGLRSWANLPFYIMRGSWKASARAKNVLAPQATAILRKHFSPSHAFQHMKLWGFEPLDASPSLVGYPFSFFFTLT